MNFYQEIQNAIDSALATQFFQGGALLAILASIGYQSKSAFIWLWTRFIRAIKYSVYIDETNDELYTAFSSWYYTNSPKSFRNVFADIKKGDDGQYTVQLSQQFDLNILRYKGRTLFVNKDRETLENSNAIGNRHLHNYTIYGFFARKIINRLLEECCQTKCKEELAHKESKGLRIHFNINSVWDWKRLKRVKTFDGIFFNKKQELLDDIDNYRKNGLLYESLNISNKRGYLLSGPPGNGKSTIPLAMAKDLGMNIYYVNLSNIVSDGDLQSYMAEVHDNSILVFEDIDVLVGNNSTTRSGGTRDNTRVSFSSLLNVLSGVFEPDNCIVVMTTNHPDKLDPALIRSGRVDIHLEIDNPDIGVARQFVTRFYGLDPIGYRFPDNLQLSIPMAEVQDYCIRNPNDPDAVVKLLMGVITPK
tara:strand:- start:1519 stop:2772 length:1254 start_codon:yes stop_codon:yes gene_type:complete